MQTITYTSAQARLADTIDRVCADHEPVSITWEQSQTVIMPSPDDDNAPVETAHAMRSPTNARRLLDAIDEVQRGGSTERQRIQMTLVFAEQPRAN